VIKPLKQYLSADVIPRKWEIVKGAEFWISISLGLAAGGGGEAALFSNTIFGDLFVAAMSYAAIAMGFCLAGLTLALTLPDREFAKKLATTRHKSSLMSSYSNLLFVFSWTAIVHWVLVVLTISVVAAFGLEGKILEAGSPKFQRVLVGFSVALGAYGLSQFLITLITISQVGSVYIKSLNDGS
jgi:hypothetical protein